MRVKPCEKWHVTDRIGTINKTVVVSPYSMNGTPRSKNARYA